MRDPARSERKGGKAETLAPAEWLDTGGSPSPNVYAGSNSDSASKALSSLKAPLRLEYRNPAELADNPRNWRKHLPTQLRPLKAALDCVGWAGALLWNETTGRLIDGHARKQLAGKNESVPVLIGSWTEDEERLILATLDPLGALAERDADALAGLLGEIKATDEPSPDLLELLASLGPDRVSEPAAPKALTLTEGLRYQVIVQCADEHEQRALLDRFSTEGLQCRALIS